MNNPFKIKGPVVKITVEDWACGCRIWPIVTSTLTWSPGKEGWKREAWFTGVCKLCREYPRPM